MSQKTEKIVGYIFLGMGLICVVFSLYSAFTVFTNAAKPPEVFRLENFNFSLSLGKGNPTTEVTVFLNSEARKTVNVLLYYLFMLLILAVGNTLATIGMQFIREIKVQMRKEG